MMICGRFAPREVDQMTMWEINALTAYHNDHHADPKDKNKAKKILGDDEVDDIGSWLDEEK